MLAVQIFGTQTTTKETTHSKGTNGKNKLEKTTKMYFPVILRATLHKEGIGKK